MWMVAARHGRELRHRVHPRLEAVARESYPRRLKLPSFNAVVVIDSCGHALQHDGTRLNETGAQQES
jgi:hypothetical protein